MTEGTLKCCQHMEMNVFCLCTWSDLSCFSPSYITARAPGLSLYRAGILYLEPDLYTNTHTAREGAMRPPPLPPLPAAAIASNIISFPHFNVLLRTTFKERRIEELVEAIVVSKARVGMGGLTFSWSIQSIQTIQRCIIFFYLFVSHLSHFQVAILISFPLLPPCQVWDMLLNSIDALQTLWTPKRDPPRKGGETENNSFFSLSLSLCFFVLRLLESSLLNAEVKEGEILPPTIQRLMKGYNKYLRPFFDSKGAADTCSHGNDRTPRGNLCLGESKTGS